MGFLNKATYFTALLRLLPMGLLALFYGANGLINKSSIEDLYKIEGEILYYGVTDIYSHTTQKIKKAYVIKVLNKKNDTITCHTFVRNYIETFKYSKFEQGKYITIYVDPVIDNTIMEVSYNNEEIIEYNGGLLLYIFFLIIGLIYTVITLGYLIKHPEHLFKKKEKIDEPSMISIQAKKQELSFSKNEKQNNEMNFGHYEHCPACGHKLHKKDNKCSDCGLNLS